MQLENDFRPLSNKNSGQDFILPKEKIRKGSERIIYTASNILRSQSEADVRTLS